MKRVLFVDDEPQILQALKNLLRPYRHRWEMTFATSGQEALERIAQGPFDVVVSDMRMPRMDGVALLTQVKEVSPRSVRIVLSGHTEMEAALKTVTVAHQFLAKPCDAEQLQSVLQRACALNDLLADESLRGLAGKIGQLPSAPAVFQALTVALGNPDASIKSIAEVIERDMAMSAKVLQLVNSAFFGLPRRVANVADAVTYLGTRMIRNLVLAAETFSVFPATRTAPGFSLEALQGHSLIVASIARKLVNEKSKAEDCYVAGMLHDIGKLILVTYMPEQWNESVGDLSKPMHVVEEEKGFVGHAKIGAYLLGLWGLPYPIIEAVAYHHAPMSIGTHSTLELPDVLYVADWLERQLVTGPRGESETRIDTDYLASIGVGKDRLDEWQRMVEQIVKKTD
jgi:putative nucleotidyltransferase with HDIG domain